MSNTVRRAMIVVALAVAAGALPTAPAEAKLRKLYSWSFPIELNDTGVELPIEGFSQGVAEARAVAELRRCFNCSFPVRGAPKQYPRNGQLLPLKGCTGAGTICKPASVRSYTSIKGAVFQNLMLVAQQGHFDGRAHGLDFGRFIGWRLPMLAGPG